MNDHAFTISIKVSPGDKRRPAACMLVCSCGSIFRAFKKATEDQIRGWSDAHRKKHAPGVHIIPIQGGRHA